MGSDGKMWGTQFILQPQGYVALLGGLLAECSHSPFPVNLKGGCCHLPSQQRKMPRLRRVRLFSGVTHAVRTWTQGLGNGGALEELLET